jgi:hypothetical protein
MAGLLGLSSIANDDIEFVMSQPDGRHAIMAYLVQGSTWTNDVSHTVPRLPTMCLLLSTGRYSM